ncbi:MAG: FAD-binding oxidoreductase, partial [Saprospiraceae bacterium]|nr:FAD-binding oxidoreductase [Saprospiraceae bacterium]
MSITTDTAIISQLKEILKGDQILTGDALDSRYHHIWRMDEPLKALAVVLPRTTQDVSEILK